MKVVSHNSICNPYVLIQILPTGLFQAPKLGAESFLTFHQIFGNAFQVTLKSHAQLVADQTDFIDNWILKPLTCFIGTRECR